MKRLIIILVVVLLGGYLSLTMLGGSGNFSAEKKLWKLEQEYKTIAADPEASPDNVYSDLHVGYDKFIIKAKDKKFINVAHMMKSNLYILQENYAKARENYEIVATSGNHTMALQAVVSIGRTYAKEKNELALLDNYQRIIANFPKSQMGLKVPLLVAQYYVKENQISLVEKSFYDAELHYRKLYEENIDTPLGFYALQYLSVTYVTQQKWEKALDAYQTSLFKYADYNVWTPESLMKWVRTVNTIAITKHKSFEYPVGLYNEFIQNKPDHPFTPIFEKVLVSLKEIKEKSTSIDTVVEDTLNNAI
ncbi:MAG: tetratricopeptide (TPR) repeat protein, partial [Candidatus Omnitrophota bacterium]